MHRVVVLLFVLWVQSAVASSTFDELLTFTTKVATKEECDANSSFSLHLNGRRTLLCRDVIEILENKTCTRNLRLMSEIIGNLTTQIREAEKQLPKEFSLVAELLGEKLKPECAELIRNLVMLDDYSNLIEEKFLILQRISDLLHAGRDYSPYADEEVIIGMRTMVYKMFSLVNPNQIEKKFDNNIFKMLSDNILQICDNEIPALKKQLNEVYEIISLIDMKGYYTLKFIQKLYSHFTGVDFKNESDKISSDFMERRSGYEKAISIAVTNLMERQESC